MSYWLLLLLLPSIMGFLFWRMKKIPHGYVQWRTGAALKVMPSLDDFPPVKMRNILEKMVDKRLPSIRRSLPVNEIKDFNIPTRHGEIPARFYNHNADPSLPIIVLMHGGGFCLGSFNVYEELTRRLARVTGHALISLEYSLAPEFKFPQGHEECEDATLWVAENASTFGIHSKQVIPLGDSAGGNLALATYFALRKKGKEEIVNSIVAVYPAVGGSDENTPSVRDYGKGYILTKGAMENFTSSLIRTKEDLVDPRLAIHLESDVSNFPPLFVLTAEFDPLRDESEGFAARVKADGNEVHTKRYKGTVHSFFGLKLMGSQGVTAIDDIGVWLSKVSKRSSQETLTNA